MATGLGHLRTCRAGSWRSCTNCGDGATRQARSRDIPSRQVLRDDLMLELARRASADEQRIRAVRGMDWRKLQRSIPEIAECIARGLNLPDEHCPNSGPKIAASVNTACWASSWRRRSTAWHAPPTSRPG